VQVHGSHSTWDDAVESRRLRTRFGAIDNGPDFADNECRGGLDGPEMVIVRIEFGERDNFCFFWSIHFCIAFVFVLFLACL